MKIFIIKIISFALFIFLLGEISVRIFKLAPDVPQLYLDKTGIKKYILGQEGYYTRATSKWKVNKYGWLGIDDTKKDTIISIIGDSFIENLINPISCNQGSLLKSNFKNYSFFETGRSGVTFIEAMQITNLLDTAIRPKLYLLYLSKFDFIESFANEERHPELVQIDLRTNQIINGHLENPIGRKLLYKFKIIYYLYLRFKSQAELERKHSGPEVAVDMKNVTKCFNYCKQHYNIKKIIMVFHPATDPALIHLAKQYGFRTISLEFEGNKSKWVINNADPHWSCYAHEQIVKQISTVLLQKVRE